MVHQDMQVDKVDRDCLAVFGPRVTAFKWPPVRKIYPQEADQGAFGPPGHGDGQGWLRLPGLGSCSHTRGTHSK